MVQRLLRVRRARGHGRCPAATRHVQRGSGVAGVPPPFSVVARHARARRLPASGRPGRRVCLRHPRRRPRPFHHARSASVPVHECPARECPETLRLLRRAHAQGRFVEAPAPVARRRPGRLPLPRTRPGTLGPRPAALHRALRPRPHQARPRLTRRSRTRARRGARLYPGDRSRLAGRARRAVEGGVPQAVPCGRRRPHAAGPEEVARHGATLGQPRTRW